MKKWLSLFLALTICMSFCFNESGLAETTPHFRSMSDPAVLPYIEETAYRSLVEELGSDDFFVENVQAVYISQEYLEELAYNSKANVFFGFTLAELEAQFQGEKYIFTLGDNDETVVEPWSDYVDPFEEVLQNLAVGAGVILLCVTVTIVTYGAGATTLSMIFATAATYSAVEAVSDGLYTGIAAGVVKYAETGSLDEAFKTAALEGSREFKNGAVRGAKNGLKKGIKTAVFGGRSNLINTPMTHLADTVAAKIQQESGLPSAIIKCFTSAIQYEIVKNKNYSSFKSLAQYLLFPDIDLEYTDSQGRTNRQRMAEGLAAIDPATGRAYIMSVLDPENSSAVAILTEDEYSQDENWQMLGSGSESLSESNGQTSKLWKALLKYLDESLSR